MVPKRDLSKSNMKLLIRSYSIENLKSSLGADGRIYVKGGRDMISIFYYFLSVKCVGYYVVVISYGHGRSNMLSNLNIIILRLWAIWNTVN